MYLSAAEITVLLVQSCTEKTTGLGITECFSALQQTRRKITDNTKNMQTLERPEETTVKAKQETSQQTEICSLSLLKISLIRKHQGMEFSHSCANDKRSPLKDSQEKFLASRCLDSNIDPIYFRHSAVMLPLAPPSAPI